MAVEKIAENSEIVITPFLNLDFIFYLIYLFFKSISDFFMSPFSTDTSTSINFLNVIKYAADGKAVLDPDKYSRFGDGIGALYDGYSLFHPPHGLPDFGGISGWLDNFFNNPYCASCPSFADLFFGGVNTYLYGLITLGLLGLLFLKHKLAALEEHESILYDTVYDKDEVNESSKKGQRWEKILSLLNSENENDWRAAILDADNLLEEVLEENGFYGNSIGERLKRANFSTLQNAWAGHKVRNSIAHDPNYNLTQRDAKVAISNFGQVFSEFYHL